MSLIKNYSLFSKGAASPHLMQEFAQLAITIFLTAVIYFYAAKLGFTMAFTAQQVTLVWPATGIALTALLLFGFRVWPAITIGAFLANVTTHEPVLTALGISVGNTLEAVAGAWMLKRFVDFNPGLQRLKDVWGLILFSGVLSTMISATIGVTSLCLGGVQPWDSFDLLWFIWWLGDAGGLLVVAPVLLVWGTPPYGKIAFKKILRRSF
jgi:integral membrane sensor domain MASE1